ncbi:MULTISPECIES: hypothetical protein [Staphylococcus]|uniref:hypothetical protein n=1 Tax=Staphylococcus TaxID=1279 RepID=UPI000AD384F1|nr:MULTISPECIES: hypothetical protein [Staphylococcus]MCI2871391.1 hypothetical protein [Staphylococcus hominis]MCI2872936.1 hypothetical protein [Staphylococcus hominis]MCI2875638.1 hypothetical protein [Staphylococcus hominis]MCI2890885.1 hypothetical protein [Staphylococcus hominis]MCI2919674.1 hypothetical protein [Staphylococcus hominis]
MANRLLKVHKIRAFSVSKLEKKINKVKSYRSIDIIEIKRQSYLFLNIAEVYYKEKI